MIKRQLLRKRSDAGAVAVMTGLMAPVLIGFAALAIDGGYWIGSQDALQSQANAGAISAVRAETYGLTSVAAIKTVAKRAAREANSSMKHASVQVSPGNGKASVLMKNGAPVYLAKVLGITGFTLSAAATSGGAAVNRHITGCLITFSKTAAESIYVEGGVAITARKCGVIANSTASSQSNGRGNAIVAEPSASITAPQILSAGGIYANTNGGAYIGAAPGKQGVVKPHGSPASDPLAAMGAPPPIPAMPSMPSNGSPVNVSGSGERFAYVAPWSKPWGGCTGSYTAACYVNAGSFDGFSTDTSSFAFRTGSATPNDASLYTVRGQIDLGGPSQTNTFGAGTYFLQGDLKKGKPADYALKANVPALTVKAGSTVYANGGVDLSGSGTKADFGKGYYYFSAASQGTGYAFTADSQDITFGGGTYVFNGPVNLSAQDNVTFGPGIYIISNGTFTVGAGASITANGATFVLENGANFSFSGGSSGNDLSAPTTNCVKPADYPLSAYTSKAPYDGTNGEGICGVLFYQARNDSTPDTFVGSATIGINGIIYTPAADLSLTGGASINPASAKASTGLLAYEVSAKGSSSITLQTPSASPLTNVTYPVSEPILTK